MAVFKHKIDGTDTLHTNRSLNLIAGAGITLTEVAPDGVQIDHQNPAAPVVVASGAYWPSVGRTQASGGWAGEAVQTIVPFPLTVYGIRMQFSVHTSGDIAVGIHASDFASLLATSGAVAVGSLTYDAQGWATVPLTAPYALAAGTYVLSEIGSSANVVGYTGLGANVGKYTPTPGTLPVDISGWTSNVYAPDLILVAN